MKCVMKCVTKTWDAKWLFFSETLELNLEK